MIRYFPLKELSPTPLHYPLLLAIDLILRRLHKLAASMTYGFTSSGSTYTRAQGHEARSNTFSTFLMNGT